MPGANTFPEGTTPLITDNEHRLWIKYNQIMFDTHGNVGSVPYPEGTQPLITDDEHRSEVKVNAILKAIA